MSINAASWVINQASGNKVNRVNTSEVYPPERVVPTPLYRKPFFLKMACVVYHQVKDNLMLIDIQNGMCCISTSER